MGKIFEEFDLQEAMRLAKSDAGRQLMAMLQSDHGSQMRAAMDSARLGDMEAAKKALADCMADPRTQALLRQMQEERHG